jgi:hypothetical protein
MCHFVLEEECQRGAKAYKTKTATKLTKQSKTATKLTRLKQRSKS